MVIRMIDWIRGGVQPRGASTGDSFWNPLPCSVVRLPAVHVLLACKGYAVPALDHGALQRYSIADLLSVLG